MSLRKYIYSYVFNRYSSRTGLNKSSKSETNRTLPEENYLTSFKLLLSS